MNFCIGKSREKIWSQEDQYAPVLSAIAARLLMLMSVEDDRKLKQGDYKNAFCSRILPNDELCIVKTPTGRPCSQPGIYWKLNKTFYDLARSAHH